MKRINCADCGARIIFATTEAGKKQALNFTPDPAGNVAAEVDHMENWRARHSPPGEALIFPERRMMPHAATCARRPQQAAEPPPEVAQMDAWRKALADLKRGRRTGRGRRQPPIAGVRRRTP